MLEVTKLKNLLVLYQKQKFNFFYYLQCIRMNKQGLCTKVLPMYLITDLLGLAKIS